MAERDAEAGEAISHQRRRTDRARRADQRHRQRIQEQTGQINSVRSGGVVFRVPARHEHFTERRDAPLPRNRIGGRVLRIDKSGVIPILLIEQGHTIPVARVAAMHEGKRLAKSRREQP